MHHHRSASKQEKPPQKRATSKGPRVGVKARDLATSGKQDRINMLKQQRQAKKDEVLETLRCGTLAPKTVVLLPLHTQADVLSLKRRLLACCGCQESEVAALAPHEIRGAVLPDFAKSQGGKAKMVLIDPPRDVISAVDACKVADIVMCVLGPRASLEEPSFDEQGYRLLTALKAQGLPVVMGAVHGPDGLAAIQADVAQRSTTDKPELLQRKAAEALKKDMGFVTRYFHSELGQDTKLYSAHTDDELKALLRGIGTAVPKDVTWRADRGYLMATEVQYSLDQQALRIRGYVRGAGFRCKRLVHLTGHGDFVVGRIALAQDPLAKERKGAAASSDLAEEQIVEELAPGQKPDLERLQPYDPAMAEQTWPTKEELGEMPPPPRPRKKPVPGKIAAPDGGGGDEGMEDEDAEAEGEAEGSDEDLASRAESEHSIGTDVWGASSEVDREISAAHVEAERRRHRQVELVERSQDDMEFPDEVDTPLDKSAKERFQKYRGLKSFRTSPWDPYEELPIAYSRIYEYESFGSTARTCRSRFQEECEELAIPGQEEGGVANRYCSLYLTNVPPNVMQNQAQGVPFIVSSLFDGEQRVSVVHGNVARHKEYEAVIKSKAELVMHCGFRRFMACPIFSEIPKGQSPCKKWRFMRFLHPGSEACASFYAPTIFPPSRLMIFSTAAPGQQPDLIASGNITGANPKQLIIKKVVLSGYPFKVHKSKAVVRYMFFRPPDIRWFKPVELTTKKGLRGHIKESLGTKGYMKCRFNQHIGQDDTVCLNLFKRVYPKWYPPSWGGSIEYKPDDS